MILSYYNGTIVLQWYYVCCTLLLELCDISEDAKVDEQFGEFQAALGIDTKHLNFSGKGSSGLSVCLLYHNKQ